MKSTCWINLFLAAGANAQRVVQASIQHFESKDLGPAVPLIKLGLGTPAQDITGIFDTASSDIIVPEAASFKPDAAADLQLLAGKSFNATLSRGEHFEGDYAKTTVTLGGVEVSGAQVGLASNIQTQATISEFAVVGVGLVAGEATANKYNNLPRILNVSGVTNSQAYSVVLNATPSGNGSVFFGGIDRSKFTGELQQVPLVKDKAGKFSEFLVELSSIALIPATAPAKIRRSTRQERREHIRRMSWHRKRQDFFPDGGEGSLDFGPDGGDGSLGFGPDEQLSSPTPDEQLFVPGPSGPSPPLNGIQGPFEDIFQGPSDGIDTDGIDNRIQDPSNDRNQGFPGGFDDSFQNRPDDGAQGSFDGEQRLPQEQQGDINSGIDINGPSKENQNLGGFPDDDTRGGDGNSIDNPADDVVENPAGNIVEDPAGNIVEDPAGNIVENPAGNIVEDPAGNIIGNPAGNIVEDPAGNIVEDPAGNIVEDPAGNIVEDPAGNIVEDPAGNIVEDPAGNIVENPAGNIVEDPAGNIIGNPADGKEPGNNQGITDGNNPSEGPASNSPVNNDGGKNNEPPKEEAPSNNTPVNNDDGKNNELPKPAAPTNTPVNNDDGKDKELPKQEAPQEEAPKKEAPQKEAPQKEAPQKEAPQKEAPQKEAPQKEAPQKEAPQKEAPQKEAPQKEAPQKEAPQKEAPQKEAPQKEAPQKEAPQKEAPQKEAPQKEAPQKEAPKKEAPKKEAPKKEAPKKDNGSGQPAKLISAIDLNLDQRSAVTLMNTAGGAMALPAGVVARMARALGTSFSATDGLGPVDCGRLGGGAALLMRFRNDTVEARVPLANVRVSADLADPAITQRGLCQVAVRPVPDGGAEVNVATLPFFAAVYTVFDLGNSSLWFAQARGDPAAAGGAQLEEFP